MSEHDIPPETVMGLIQKVNSCVTGDPVNLVTDDQLIGWSEEMRRLRARVNELESMMCGHCGRHP